MHFSHRLHIDLPAPPEAVFALIGDYARDPEWREGVRMRSEPVGVVRDGTRTYEELRLFGSTHRTIATVEQVRGDRSFRFVSDDGNVEGKRCVEPHDAGSRLTVELRVRLSGLMGLFAPLLGFVFRRRVQRDLARLRGLLASPR